MSRLALTVEVLQRTGGVDEYVVVERRRELWARDRAEERRAGGVTVTATVFRDLRRGRGQASFVVDTDDRGRVAEAATAAAALARRAVGPPWSMPPPAAPARVEVADPALAGDAGEVAAGALEALVATGGAAVQAASVRATRDTIATQTSHGFSNAFVATAIAADVAMAGDGPAARVTGSSRRAADLDAARLCARAAEIVLRRGRAGPLAPGRYDLLLHPAAIVGSDRGYGLLAPLVTQADATRVRNGVGLYRSGQAIAEGAGGITVVSDGTLPFGPRSRPFGDLGEPVRRFPLVENGVAAGVGLPLREAALAGREPNGGVANLIVAPGAAALDELRQPGEHPLVEILEPAWLDVDPDSGAVAIGIALGRLRANGAEPVWLAGGTVRGNLYGWLGRARLSAETATLAWYTGPNGIHVADVTA
jgi:predicted Zn-dependent protease